MVARERLLKNGKHVALPFVDVALGTRVPGDADVDIKFMVRREGVPTGHPDGAVSFDVQDRNPFRDRPALAAAF
ncbi:hypothetical protein KL86PLE_110069 [uncultured Pleomorphomonas sp.]|uniref:Uncharacterized protein n=1 Tax=uncultured Pleomorphomonas sp. TaxID=442121 RepID=A0A212L794_9HYPH|nr:hypothetical protein KL86PLE_110069 [uncultured Pleomorphomonas sp.]